MNKNNRNMNKVAQSYDTLDMSNNSDAQTMEHTSAADEKSFRAQMEDFMNYKPAYSAEEF